MMRCVLLLLLGGAASQALTAAEAPATNQPLTAISAAEERAGCILNLETIHKAIKAYQADNRDLPMWLSDLVPQYMPDANVLICPVSRRTGKTESAPYVDPKIPCSYVFEFSPAKLGAPYGPHSTRTWREWKRRQMGVIGSAVPMVRCRHHTPTLNLGFDGKIAEYPGKWETAFTNITALSSLEPAALFADDAPRKPSRFPARTARATPRQLDLGDHFNAALNEKWLGNPDKSLESVPKGLQMVDGTNFDIRALIQLAGKGLNTNFPRQVTGIPVRLKCKKLHFLHATAGEPGEPEAQVGFYTIKLVNNPARITIPVLAGKDVQCWDPVAPLMEEGAKPATFASTAGKEQQRARLFKTTWTNLVPDLEVESITVDSDPAKGGLLVIAITAE